MHWGLEPIRRPKVGTGARSARPKAGTDLHWGHGVPAGGRHWPALGHGVPAEGRHWGTECPALGLHWPALGHGVLPAEGLHWGMECPALGRHWPALGARRSAGLPAEGRRWLGRRPDTAARAVCARRSEQCAVMYGARLSSMRTL